MRDLALALRRGEHFARLPERYEEQRLMVVRIRGLSLEEQVALAGLPVPEREHHFALPRKWRFDFCWPALLVALEREGGTWRRPNYADPTDTRWKSRHSTGPGYRNDCLKYNEAVLRGWLLIRATADMVESGLALATVERALRTRGWAT